MLIVIFQDIVEDTRKKREIYGHLSGFLKQTKEHWQSFASESSESLLTKSLFLFYCLLWDFKIPWLWSKKNSGVISLSELFCCFWPVFNGFKFLLALMYFVRNLGEFYLFLIVNWCMDIEKEPICLMEITSRKNHSGIHTRAHKSRHKQLPISTITLSN